LGFILGVLCCRVRCIWLWLLVVLVLVS